MNVQNKLDCDITLGWKSLAGTNTLVYLANLGIMKTMKYCESDYWTVFTTRQSLNRSNKLEHYVVLG